MSLGRWFKEYVFIPLGGSRVSSSVTVRNLVIVFFLSGLWHGAGWNFICWGLFHGILLSIWPTVTRNLPLLGKAGGPAGVVIRVILTFVIMHIGRVLFREHNLAMIWQHLTLNPMAASVLDWRVGCALGIEAVLYGLPLTLVYPLVEYFGWLPAAEDKRWNTWSWTLFQAFGAVVLVMGLVLLRSTEGSDFIYFQF
jgi:alginate O-acetyltransferase complex protein AlgI